MENCTRDCQTVMVAKCEVIVREKYTVLSTIFKLQWHLLAVLVLCKEHDDGTLSLMKLCIKFFFQRKKKQKKSCDSICTHSV